MSKRKAKHKREAAATKRAHRQSQQLHALRQQLRLYDAATATDWRPLRGSGASADSVNQNAGTRLRDSARHADENDGGAIAILDDLIDNIVGSGRPVQPMVRRRDGEPADRANKAIAAWWSKWWARPETTGELPGDEMERLAVRTWLRDGEVFTQHVSNPPIGELPHSLGYLLELLESDYVPHDLFSGRDTSASQNTVVHGVELNRWRRPVAYHVLREHPGALRQPSGRTGQARVVAAANMLHLKFRRRLHQVRGVTVLHAALTTLQDLRESWESERIGMRVAAAMTAYVKRGPEFASTDDLLANIQGSTVGARGFELQPGMVWDQLLPGEEVGTISSDRPNQNFDPFTAALQRTLAGATGTRYSSISHRFDGSYSSQRQELVEGVIAYRRLYSYHLQAWKLPIYRRAIDAGILTGALQLPGSVDRATLYEVDIPPPSLPWIDPAKEIKAYREAIDGELIARHQAIRELGRDPSQVDQLITEERARLAEIAAEMAAAAPAPAGATSADDAPGDDSEAASNAA